MRKYPINLSIEGIMKLLLDIAEQAFNEGIIFQPTTDKEKIKSLFKNTKTYKDITDP